MKFVLSGLFCAALFSVCFYYRRKQTELQKQFEELSRSYSNLNKSYSALHDNWHSDIRDNYTTLQELRIELDKLKLSENSLKTLLNDVENRWKNFAEKEILKHKTELETWKGTELQKEIDKSVNKSRTILRGKTMEQFAPFTEEMKEFSPTDFRFIGTPFDYVIIKGAGEVSDGVKDEIEELVIADIKTGSSNLTKLQKAVKKAVDEKRVRWTTIKLG
jgi:predicted Holliday junction resolvase-like endonuclease